MTISPNAIDLTTLANVKNRAEVTTSNDDADIQAAITAFSQWLLDFTGKTTLNSIASLTETYDGNGNQRLFLRSNPILTLTSVTMNGAGLPISSGQTAWGCYVDQSGKSIGLRGGIGQFSTFPYPTAYGTPYGGVRARGPVFYLGQQNIVVVYTAGYGPVSVTNDVETIAANTVTLAQGPWVADQGVSFYPSLVPLAKVANSPVSGQYAVTNGLYVFATADEGKQVLLNYQINQAPYDLEYAVRCVVAINYKRKAWQDQKSRAVAAQGGGSATTSYRDWAWPPEYENIFQNYKRTSII